jgi:hypothetical protein
MATFVDEHPGTAQGGKGVVVSGCVHCRKMIRSMAQFIEQIAIEELPGIFERGPPSEQPTRDQLRGRSCVPNSFVHTNYLSPGPPAVFKQRSAAFLVLTSSTA